MHFGNSTSICHPLSAFLFSFPATICLSVAMLSIDCHNWIVVQNGLSSHERRSSVCPKDEREDLSVRKKAGLEWFGRVLKRIIHCLTKRASLALVPVRACVVFEVAGAEPRRIISRFFFGNWLLMFDRFFSSIIGSGTNETNFGFDSGAQRSDQSPDSNYDGRQLRSA